MIPEQVKFCDAPMKSRNKTNQWLQEQGMKEQAAQAQPPKSFNLSKIRAKSRAQKLLHF